MLNVCYHSTYGYINVLGTDGETIFKSLLHPANCLVGCVYHDKKNHLAHLVFWANDMGHLKRCLQDHLDIENFKKIVIYTNTDWKERYKVAELFQKYGYNVEMKPCKRWHRKPKTRKEVR